MFDDVGERFFTALRDAAERRLGRGHPCLAALDKAAGEAGPATIHAAQDALAALEPDVVAALMADAHKALREDSRAILGAWTKGGAPN